MNGRVLLPLALALLALLACGKRESPPTKTAAHDHAAEKHDHANDKHADEARHVEEGLLKLSEEEIRNAGIKIEPLQPKAVRGEMTATATIQPNQDKLAHVSPQVAGRIVSVPVSLGDRVRPGQTLAVLDSIEVGEARSAYLQAKSEAALAQSEYERSKRLFDQEVVPQKDYLRALSQREKTAAALRAASGKLRMLGASTGASEARSTLSPEFHFWRHGIGETRSPRRNRRAQRVTLHDR